MYRVCVIIDFCFVKSYLFDPQECKLMQNHVTYQKI
jgi:hypothetical protein